MILAMVNSASLNACSSDSLIGTQLWTEQNRAQSEEAHRLLIQVDEEDLIGGKLLLVLYQLHTANLQLIRLCKLEQTTSELSTAHHSRTSSNFSFPEFWSCFNNKRLNRLQTNS